MSDCTNPRNLPEQVEKNKDDIETLNEEKQDKTDLGLTDPSNDVVTAINENRALIDELSGSITTSAFLKVYNDDLRNIPAITETQIPTGIIDIETNPDVLSYDDINNEFFIRGGITNLNAKIVFVDSGQTPPSGSTTLVYRFYEVGTNDLLLEDSILFASGQTNLTIQFSDVYDIVQDRYVYVTAEYDKAVTVSYSDIFWQQDTSSTQSSQNIQLVDPTSESQSGTATTQYVLNQESKTKFDNLDTKNSDQDTRLDNIETKNTDQDNRLDGHDQDIIDINNELATKSDGWREIFSGNVLVTTSTSSKTLVQCTENPIQAIQYAIQFRVEQSGTSVSYPIVFYRGNGGNNGITNSFVLCYMGTGFVLMGVSTYWDFSTPSPNYLEFYASRGASVTTGSQVPYDTYVEKIWIVNE